MTKEAIIEEILDETLEDIRKPRRERIARYIELYERKKIMYRKSGDLVGKQSNG